MKQLFENIAERVELKLLYVNTDLQSFELDQLTHSDFGSDGLLMMVTPINNDSRVSVFGRLRRTFEIGVIGLATMDGGQGELDAIVKKAYPRIYAIAKILKQDLGAVNIFENTQDLGISGVYANVQLRGDVANMELCDDCSEPFSLSAELKKIWAKINGLFIPTTTSALENDSGFITSDDLPDVSKLDVIQTDGNGDKYLADDGSYKEVQAGGATDDSKWEADGSTHIKPKDGKLLKLSNLDGIGNPTADIANIAENDTIQDIANKVLAVQGANADNASTVIQELAAFHFFRPIPLQFFNTAKTSGGGSALVSNINRDNALYAFVNANSESNSYAAFNTFSDNRPFGGNHNSFDYRNKFIWTFRFAINNDGNPDQQILFLLGMPDNYVPLEPISHAHVGLRVDALSLTGLSHNGQELAEINLNKTIGAGNNAVSLIFTPNQNLEYWVKTGINSWEKLGETDSIPSGSVRNCAAFYFIVTNGNGTERVRVRLTDMAMWYQM